MDVGRRRLCGVDVAQQVRPIPQGYAELSSLCHGRLARHRYSTTIYAINSAIIKLSKLTYARPVYRGLMGMSLPERFFEKDADGIAGGIEFGFSSTTSDRSVAVFYSKAEQEGKASTIIEAQQGIALLSPSNSLAIGHACNRPDQRALFY